MKNDELSDAQKIEIYDEGWGSGYHDEYPDCPYEENTPEAVSWWEGYHQGSMDC